MDDDIEAKRPPTILPRARLGERQVDILLCSELHHDGALRAHLSTLAGASGCAFAGCWVSHTEGEGEDRGENDLVVLWHDAQGDTILLIENKITAAYQPRQAERYQARLMRLRRQQGTVRAASMLIAPAAYMARPGSQTFDLLLSYETIVQLLPKHDGRSAFLRDMLTITAKGSEDHMPPDAACQRFWNIAQAIAAEIAPGLNLVAKEGASRNDTWNWMKDARGMPDHIRGLEIVYKPNNGGNAITGVGAADLSAPVQNADRFAEALAKDPSIDARLITTKATVFARIDVPFVRTDLPDALNEDAIRLGIKACERLRTLATTLP